jgi:hypothetical protein
MQPLEDAEVSCVMGEYVNWLPPPLRCGCTDGDRDSRGAEPPDLANLAWKAEAQGGGTFSLVPRRKVG